MTEDRAPVSPDDRKNHPSEAFPKNRKAPSKNEAVKSRPPNDTAPSAQSIDQIFSGRVIADEAEDARLLFRQFSEYFGAIEQAIEGEKIRVELERTKTELEYQPGTTVLPRKSVFDDLTKAMAANEHEFRRLLENLGAIRQLRGGSKNAR